MSKIYNGTVEEDNVPELPGSFFKNGVRGLDGLASLVGEEKVALLRGRGRPKGATKLIVSLSLDADVVDALRATGKGWQTRANTVLRQSLGM